MYLYEVLRRRPDSCITIGLKDKNTIQVPYKKLVRINTFFPTLIAVEESVNIALVFKYK